MAKQKKSWVYSPAKVSKDKISALVKREAEDKATELIDNILKPAHITPPTEDNSFNYIVDIYSKWYRIISVLLWLMNFSSLQKSRA